MYVVREDPPKHIRDTLHIYDELTQRLLHARGITTQEEADIFFRKDWHAIDPYQYANMQKAVDLLLNSIASDKTIGIFSDYDCDGIPASAALYTTLNAFGHKKIIYYTPDRNTEGFGLNKKGVNTMIDAGASVVCVVDCGTSNPDEISELENNGIKTIILDHHLADKTLPSTFAMINPTVEPNIKKPYPCAAGVVYIFIQALIQQAHSTPMQIKPKMGWEKWQLDIIGLATLSDMVPLRGINRQFVHYGLQVLRKSPRPGIQALCKKINLNQQKITQDDLSFLVIPKINAASRMGKAETAFTLLTTNDIEEAMTLADAVTALNNKRKTAVATMVRAAHKQAEAKNKEKEVWVFGNREWKPSLVGLVAQKLSESYGKTIFVWGQGGSGEGEPSIKGSCRSNKHDVFTLMQKVPDMFAKSGGHEQAGGFTLTRGAEVVLEDELNNNVTASKGEAEEVKIDKECSVSDIAAVFTLYEKFSPFGMENESIRIAIPRCRIHKQFKFGKNKEHIRYTFADETGYVDGIAFFTKDDESATDPLTVIGQVEYDSFRNKPQIHVITLLS